ncbi:UbiX family flavin prenyltransferase [Campylobacter sp. RM12654]|uniref:UbiX family flavin prenyltransferase n=1 Tax=unclassified Campylobacter TaxID=2593542 RepID=UPI00301422B8|nr:UbiX family flavin prenyltransferase [Campylobacter sp. RM12637]MBZ7977873.1 UbiX family flavin prenyltransferase [Campylobacter sp. RM12654]
MRFLVAINGASGVNLALKLAKVLSKENEVYLILSKGALKVLKEENNKKIKKYIKNTNITLLKNDDLAAPVSSGSFKLDAAFYYASSDFLAKASYGFSDTLILRSFAVNLKENRKIIIAPREMPLNELMLKNILKLNKLGCIIAPAIYAKYSKSSFKEFVIGKWCDLLGVEYKKFKRWKSE